MLYALGVAAELSPKTELVVTSTLEGKHMEGSLHYQGLAVDIRIKDVEKPEEWAVAIKTALNSQDHEFDVLLETDHIHIEYDPKQ